MGRFLSPDWSKTPDAVPYADLSNPQSLNLHSYVRNNPLTRTDADGHTPDWLQRVLNCFTGFCGMTNDRKSAQIETEWNDLIQWQAKFNGQTPDYKNLPKPS
jgi:hypothetical protein